MSLTNEISVRVYSNKQLKLIEACKKLAMESQQWHLIKEIAEKEGKTLSEDELYRLSHKGAWKEYLEAGGSLTMINDQLEPEDDFGGQITKLRSSVIKNVGGAQ